MNLFERLIYRRLCNEQAAAGGESNAASAPPAAHADDNPAPAASAPSAEATPPQADKPQPGAEADKPAEGDKPAEEKKPEGAPEKYDFKAGEGVELDQEALKDFEPVARELNLTNEQAQKLVDAYSTKILPLVQKQQAEAWQKQTEGWAEAVKADKDIGGANLTSSISSAQRALEIFGDADLKQYLNETGLGNHPALVKAFVKVGKAMSEDKVVTGGHESGGSDLISAFYPKK